MQVLPILHEGIEHLWIMVLVGVLEPNPLWILRDEMMIVLFFLGLEALKSK